MTRGRGWRRQHSIQSQFSLIFVMNGILSWDDMAVMVLVTRPHHRIAYNRAAAFYSVVSGRTVLQHTKIKIRRSSLHLSCRNFDVISQSLLPKQLTHCGVEFLVRPFFLTTTLASHHHQPNSALLSSPCEVHQSKTKRTSASTHVLLGIHTRQDSVLRTLLCCRSSPAEQQHFFCSTCSPPTFYSSYHSRNSCFELNTHNGPHFSPQIGLKSLLRRLFYPCQDRDGRHRAASHT